MQSRIALVVLTIALCATVALGVVDVATEIVSPRSTEPPGPVPVIVRLTNLGDVPALVQHLDVTIRPSGFYVDLENILIPVGANQVVTSNGWDYSGGTETCTAWITYPADSNHSNDTDVVIVNVAGIPGRVEIETNARMSLTLSPSPLAGNVLHVEYGLNQAGPATVTLFDISGRAVLKRRLGIARTDEFSLDLRNLSAGVYLVRLDDGRQSVMQKLVVQR